MMYMHYWEGEIKMEIKTKLDAYIKKIGFNEEQVAMVSLGYLIREVSLKQKGLKGREMFLRNIPDFMDERNIIETSNEVVGYLIEHDMFNEENISIYFQFNYYFNKHISDWKMSDNDNKYYIYSGCSIRGVEGMGLFDFWK